MRINGHPAPLHAIGFEQERHRYYLPDRPEHRIPSITGIIDALGMGFPSHRMAPAGLEEARERGRFVHGCAALLAIDDLNVAAIPVEYDGWIAALHKAYEHLRLRPLLVEEPLYEPLYDFAGTLDFFGRSTTLVRPPGTALIELKTGDYRGVDMQLGAQAALLRANYPQVGPLECFVLHLDGDGRWGVDRMDAEQGWQDFAAARRLYARLQRKRKEEAET